MKDTLQKWSLKNIEFQEITNFLKENNQIEWIKEFVRNYLFWVLQGNNWQIKKEDFEVMKDYVKRLKEYQNILKSKIVSKEFSLWFVEKIIFSQSLEDFSNFLNNANVIKFLSWKKENIEYTIKSFKINTIKEFEGFCSNKNIR